MIVMYIIDFNLMINLQGFQQGYDVVAAEIFGCQLSTQTNILLVFRKLRDSLVSCIFMLPTLTFFLRFVSYTNKYVALLQQGSLLIKNNFKRFGIFFFLIFFILYFACL